MSDLTARIASDLLMPHSYALRVIRSAPHRYKTYPIEKRGGKGVRIIAQPAREVKRIQYWVLENVLATLPVHPAATAYETGSTILANAKIHAPNPYLLKLDFADFFPSITANDFCRFAERELQDRLDEAIMGATPSIESASYHTS